MAGFFQCLYIGCIVTVWLGIAFYMFRVVSLRKPHVRLWRDTLYNPFNLILMSSKLTSKGLKARRTLFLLVLVFILLCLVPLIF